MPLSAVPVDSAKYTTTKTCSQKNIVVLSKKYKRVLLFKKE